MGRELREAARVERVERIGRRRQRLPAETLSFVFRPEYHSCSFYSRADLSFQRFTLSLGDFGVFHGGAERRRR